MKFVKFKQNQPHEPASWRYKFVGGAFTAAVTCPNGHQGDLADHFIGKRGEVMQVVVCSEPECDFDAHVKLEDWQPLRVVKGEDGTDRVALYPAHNRLIDMELTTAYGGLVLLRKIENILMECATAAPGEPDKWVPLALSRFRFIAMPFADWRLALPPGMRLPPPDEDGLVNFVAFIDANPRHFPSFHNPEWRQAFDQSKLALPRMLPA